MENQYVNAPAMPASFDPARYLRQPGRTQVATLVAASFVGCLLALLVVYGVIVIITKVMAAKLLKTAVTDAADAHDDLDNADSLDSPPPMRDNRPAPKPAPLPRPQPAAVTQLAPSELRLMADVMNDDYIDSDDDTGELAEPLDEETITVDLPQPSQAADVPAPTATKPTAKATTPKQPRRQ